MLSKGIQENLKKNTLISLISGILKADSMEIKSKSILPWMIMKVWGAGWAMIAQQVSIYSFLGK